MKNANPDPSRCIPCLKIPPDRISGISRRSPIMEWKSERDEAGYRRWLIEVKFNDSAVVHEKHQTHLR